MDFSCSSEPFLTCSFMHVEGSGAPFEESEQSERQGDGEGGGPKGQGQPEQETAGPARLPPG